MKNLNNKKKTKTAAALTGRKGGKLVAVTAAEANIIAAREGKAQGSIVLSGVGCRTRQPLIASACRARTMADADALVDRMQADGTIDHMRRLMAVAYFLFTCTNSCLQLVEADLEDSGLFRHAFKKYFTNWEKVTQQAIDLFHKEFTGTETKARRLLEDRDVFFPQIMKVLGMHDLAEEVGHDPSCLPDDLGPQVSTRLTMPQWVVDRFKQLARETNAKAREAGEEARLTYSDVVDMACRRALMALPEARARGERKLKERYGLSQEDN